MKKNKSIIAIILCFVLVVLSMSTKTYAAVAVPEMPVQNLNNQKVFRLLRSYAFSATTNKKYNNSQTLPQYVYNQNRVNMKVGDCSFSAVGCEIAACYNATIELLPITTRSSRKNLLPEYIYQAEANGYTMTLNSKNSKSLANELLNTYFNTWSVNIVRFFFGIDPAISLIKDPFLSAVTSLIASYTGFNKTACFGTDPYAIPNILDNVGVIQKTNTFYDYDKMLECVKTNLHYSKPKKVYIVSYWNYATLNDCFQAKNGFHTICFYTSGGSIYALNWKSNSPDSPEFVKDFERLIGNKKRFIVGYCVSLK